jgi:hypothetical protein
MKAQVKKSSKPFCKVCFDTGKSENEYRSHYVKNIPGPNGVVVCPTILSVECRYCKSIGHTVSKCPSLKSKSLSANHHHHDKKIKSNRTALLHSDDHGHEPSSLSPSTANIEVEVEVEVEEMKAKEVFPEHHHKYEVSYANMVLKPPNKTVNTVTTTTTTTTKEVVKETIIKEEGTPKKLSIIDPSLLVDSSSIYKSHTPPYPPPSFKPMSKPREFKSRPVIIHRWADDVETDM